MPGGNDVKPLQQGQTDSNSALSQFLGQIFEGFDSDEFNGTLVPNSSAKRQLMLVQNTSGGTLANGIALKFVPTFFRQQVTTATAAGPIRGYTPYSINGGLNNTIKNNEYFLMVVGGPTFAQTDGTAITENDLLVVGATSGKLKTEASLAGADNDIRGGTAIASVAALGTGSQRFVHLIASGSAAT